MKNRIITVACAALAATSLAAQPKALFEETKAQHEARMAWWKDARFGMFVKFNAEQWVQTAKNAGMKLQLDVDY